MQLLKDLWADNRVKTAVIGLVLLVVEILTGLPVEVAEGIAGSL